MRINKEEKQFLVFSYGMPLICLFLAWRQYSRFGFTCWAAVFMMAGVIVLAMALMARPWLKVLFGYWMKVMQGIGAVTTIVILTVFYCTVITPVSLIVRVMGKDFMNIRFKNREGSYWIRRGTKKSDYTQQF